MLIISSVNHFSSSLLEGSRVTLQDVVSIVSQEERGRFSQKRAQWSLIAQSPRLDGYHIGTSPTTSPLLRTIKWSPSNLR